MSVGVGGDDLARNLHAHIYHIQVDVRVGFLRDDLEEVRAALINQRVRRITYRPRRVVVADKVRDGSAIERSDVQQRHVVALLINNPR